jgi:signal transduction histidine kinase
VLSIVLDNAVEAISGRGTITLRTRALAEDAVVVEIADTGRGIDAAHLDRVFEPGFSTKGGRVTAGLSLAVAYRILERHAGRIQLSSEPGSGTTVRLTLPVARGPREV